MKSAQDFYNTAEKREIISVIVQNEDSVLSRISNLFSARGYNIDSLTVAPVPNSEYSRFTIVTVGSARTIDQIVKQLNKLIPVLKVIEHKNCIEKDTVLVKLPIGQNLSDIEVIVKAYNGSIQHITDDAIIISATNDPKRIMDFIKVIQAFHPIEIVRSGVVSIER
ncbi:MAG: acetolactate synthase small subunit [Arcobacteraceae bacterium]|jgi:acetolactate synthase-1/3 small subunit